MPVTPLDIIKKEFSPARRGGLEPVEVQEFLDEVRETLDGLLRENLRLRELLARREAEITELRQEEQSITETLMMAQRLSEDVERKSRRESDLIVGEARLEAQRILMATSDERRNLQGELLHLRSVKIRMVEDIRAVLNAHTRMLDEVDTEESSNTVEG